MIKVKLIAAGIHCLASVFVALVAAILVFLVWYPGDFAVALQGTELFVLLMGVEVVLGPLMSLVVYSTRKSRQELVKDYSVIGLVQLCALVYGLYVVALSRPVYLVFAKDRLYAVAALDIEEEKAALAQGGFQAVGYLGPKLVCFDLPSEVSEQVEIVGLAISGEPLYLYPQYYRECRRGEVASVASKLSTLSAISESSIFNSEQSETEFKWLPLVSRFGVWTAVFKPDGLPGFELININPFKMSPSSTNPPPDNASSAPQ